MNRAPFIVDAIIALDKNNGIGYNGSLPWPRVAEDMRHFRSITTGRTCICGWNTYKDVRTIAHTWQRELYPVMRDATMPFIVCDMFARNRVFRPIVIGGAKTYTQFWPFIDQFYVTDIAKEYKCDTFFPRARIQDEFPYVDQVRVFEQRPESNTPRIMIQRFSRMNPNMVPDWDNLPKQFYIDI